MFIGPKLDVWKVVQYLNGLRLSEASGERALSPAIHVACDRTNLSPVKVGKHTRLSSRAPSCHNKRKRRAIHMTLQPAARCSRDELILDAAHAGEVQEARLQLADEQVMHALWADVEDLGTPCVSEFDVMAAGEAAGLAQLVLQLNVNPLLESYAV